MTRYGVIYGGAQKTWSLRRDLVIVRDDLLDSTVSIRCVHRRSTGAMSRTTTPCSTPRRRCLFTLQVWCLKWLEQQGGCGPWPRSTTQSQTAVRIHRQLKLIATTFSPIPLMHERTVFPREESLNAVIPRRITSRGLAALKGHKWLVCARAFTTRSVWRPVQALVKFMGEFERQIVKRKNT